MKEFWLQIAALLIVTLVALELTFNSKFSLTGIGGGLNNQTATVPSQLKINDTILNITVADTPEKRAQGLGGVTSLASDSGMLFVFDKNDRYKFWMKGLDFPLDFIWIRDDIVVDLLHNIPPPLPNQSTDSLPIYAPVTEVNKVLEVNAGFIASHDIKVGDKILLIQQ